MNHKVSGNLPDIPELRACRLVPIKKKGTVDGVRPIAVGEVWLRLAAICAMEACPTKGSSLLPYQFGVGVAGGAQCVGHAVKAGMLAHPEHVTIHVDFQNAFNLLCRASMLNAVRKRAPGLSKFAASLYSKHSELLVSGAAAGSPHIQSQTVVRQGDPDGGL